MRRGGVKKRRPAQPRRGQLDGKLGDPNWKRERGSALTCRLAGGVEAHHQDAHLLLGEQTVKQL
jgi:hypothetical protein